MGGKLLQQGRLSVVIPLKKTTTTSSSNPVWKSEPSGMMKCQGAQFHASLIQINTAAVRPSATSCLQEIFVLHISPCPGSYILSATSSSRFPKPCRRWQVIYLAQLGQRTPPWLIPGTLASYRLLINHCPLQEEVSQMNNVGYSINLYV